MEKSERQIYFEEGRWCAIPEIFKLNLDKILPEIEAKGGDFSDYFNYGYNPETWRIYVKKVLKDWEHHPSIKDLKEKFQPFISFVGHPKLNFLLPHELGGLGLPYSSRYSRVNLNKVNKLGEENNLENEVPVLSSRNNGYFVKIQMSQRKQEEEPEKKEDET